MNVSKNLRTDEYLAEQLKSGNVSAMGELYSRYFMVVFHKCYSFTKNREDASDLAQDIMLRVMDKIHTYKGHAKFSTWLYSITFNYCTDNKRGVRGKYFTTLEAQYELVDESVNEKDRALEKEHKKQCAESVLESISTEDQVLLSMKYEQNKSILELQQFYQLSASAVKMRLLRARTKAALLYSERMLPAA